MVKQVSHLKYSSQQSDSSVVETSGSGDKSDQLVISSTFTAEPIQETLQFWLAQLGLPWVVSFADYNQVFQQLLNPTSLMAQNQGGVNLVLLRIEDWGRFQSLSGDDRLDDDSDEWKLSLEHSAQDFIDAMGTVARQSSTSYLVAFCPSKPGISAVHDQWYTRLEGTIAEALAPLQSVYLIRSADIFSRYPVPDYYDESRDRVGHIPYTDLAFAALGTVLAREIYALKRPPYKVIALDCDRTLWSGICGEDGPLGVAVDEPFKALQSFMVRCSELGLLLCLCSKNVEEDVWQVFSQRDDMVLSRDHIVAWRINWEPKSENLRSLAAELNLGLDSFIFVDDNPVECSEVQARCPEVLTLQLPNDPDKIPAFLDHIWPFDLLKVTDADKQRTQLYQQNRKRSKFEQESIDFQSFIQGLQIDIQIMPPLPSQMGRVAQLTQRTNQFNATTRRRTESEIQHWCEAQGYGCRAVVVKDRFGDYGLVGVMLFQLQDDTLEVDTLLLSCRVLGRGVEYRMVAHLGEIATKQNLSSVVIKYIPTPKNKPMDKFLSSIGHPYCHPQSSYTSYSFPTEFASNLTFEVSELENQQHVNAAGTASTKKTATSLTTSSEIGINKKSERWNHIAVALTTPAQIVEAVNQAFQRQNTYTSSTNNPWVAPRTEIETTLANIWCKTLRLDCVSVQDDFFALGGNSLLAVDVFTRIEDIFRRRLPITTLLNAPTIEQLAQIVEQDDSQDVWNPLVPVRENGERPPLFVVHGGFGDALSIAQIAPHLSSNQPFYALRGVGLDGKQLPLENLETMASKYLEAIKVVFPQGPYRLAGQCSGGIVAFEMAQQLIAQGEQVDFLGLIDTPYPQLENHFNNRYRYYHHFPTYRYGQWDINYYLFTAIVYLFRKWPHMFRYHYRELVKQSWQGRLEYVVSYLRKLIEILSRRLEVRKKHIDVAPSSSHHHSSKRDTQTNPVASGLTASSEDLPQISSSSQENFRWVKDRFFEVFLRAQKRYMPKAYPGKIHFFLTTLDTYVSKHHPYNPRSFVLNKNIVASVAQLRFGWDKLVEPENFRIHPMQIEHDQMLDLPYVQLLGKALDEHLQK